MAVRLWDVATGRTLEGDVASVSWDPTDYPWLLTDRGIFNPQALSDTGQSLRDVRLHPLGKE